MRDQGSSPFRRATAGLGFALLVAGFVPLAPADGGGPRVDVQIDVAKQVVSVDGDGRPVERQVPVGVVRPGDVLVYRLRATNRGEAPALRPRIEDPIPPGTVLLPESVEPAIGSPTASLDGGATWNEFPVIVETLDGEGRPIRMPAAAEAYTHLRWVLDGDLMPGESRDFTFKVRIQ